MNLTENVKNSFRYPFLNISKWAILSVLVIIGNLLTVTAFFGIETINILILGIISLVVSIFVLGYGISILQNTINLSDELPDFNIKNDFINGLKHILVSFVYLIIPLLIFIALAYLMDVTSYGFDLFTFTFTKTTILNQTADSTYSIMETATPSLNVIIMLIVSFVIFLLFALFEIIGLCRLAEYSSIKEAFKFKVIFKEFKKIGVNLLIGIIIICIIAAILGFLFSILNSISFGIIISLIGYTYLIILNYKFIGLLYTN